MFEYNSAGDPGPVEDEGMAALHAAVAPYVDDQDDQDDDQVVAMGTDDGNA